MHAIMSYRDGVRQSSFIHEDTGTLRYNLDNSNGLVKGLQYSLTLIARNSVGLSNESAPVHFTLQPTRHNIDEANIIVILVSVLASVLLLLLSIGLLVIFLVIRRKRRRAKSSISEQREQES